MENFAIMHFHVEIVKFWSISNIFELFLRGCRAPYPLWQHQCKRFTFYLPKMEAKYIFPSKNWFCTLQKSLLQACFNYLVLLPSYMNSFKHIDIFKFKFDNPPVLGLVCSCIPIILLFSFYKLEVISFCFILC